LLNYIAKRNNIMAKFEDYLDQETLDKLRAMSSPTPSPHPTPTPIEQPKGMGPLADPNDYKPSILMPVIQKQAEMQAAMPEEESDPSYVANNVFSKSNPLPPSVQEINPGFTDNTVENLRGLQEKSEADQRAAAYAKAFNMIGSGMLGKKANTVVDTSASDKLADTFADLSKNKIKNFQDRGDKENDDPNSAASVGMRHFAKPMMAKLGIKIPDNMSYNQMAKMSPMLVSMFNSQENREARIESAKLQREGMQLQREQMRQDKKDKMSQPSDKQISGLTDLDNALSALDSIESQKDKFDTGPVSNVQNKLAGMIGVDDSKKSAFKAQVGDQLAQYIKSISGAAVSDQERAFLLQNLPTMADNDATFKAKLHIVKSRLQTNKANFMKNLQAQGKSVSDFDNSNIQKNSSSKIKVSNGSETFEIDPSDLSDAEKDGFKKI
jgi:hypothetical protein